MPGNPYYRKNPRQAPVFNQFDAFGSERCYIPHETREFLRQKSADTGLPVSRLIAIAIDNERDQGEKAFHYPAELPTTPFVEFAYAEEAQLLIEFLSKFPTGTGRDTLLLCRRDIGIGKRSVLLYALKELLETGVAEEFKPKNAKYYRSKDYQRVRLVGVEREELNKKKYKRIEGESTSNRRPIVDDDIDRSGDE